MIRGPIGYMYVCMYVVYVVVYVYVYDWLQVHVFTIYMYNMYVCK